MENKKNNEKCDDIKWLIFGGFLAILGCITTIISLFIDYEVINIDKTFGTPLFVLGIIFWTIAFPIIKYCGKPEEDLLV